MADLYSNSNRLENILNLLQSKAAGGGGQVYQLFGAYALTRNDFSEIFGEETFTIYPENAYMRLIDTSQGGSRLVKITEIVFGTNNISIRCGQYQGYWSNGSTWYLSEEGGSLSLTSEETNYLVIDFQTAETLSKKQYEMFNHIFSSYGVINRLYNAGIEVGYDNGYDAGYEAVGDLIEEYAPIIIQGGVSPVKDEYTLNEYAYDINLFDDNELPFFDYMFQYRQFVDIQYRSDPLGHDYGTWQVVVTNRHPSLAIWLYFRGACEYEEHRDQIVLVRETHYKRVIVNPGETKTATFAPDGYPLDRVAWDVKPTAAKFYYVN